MKVSELIKRLQELVEEHGDLDVCIVDPDYLSPTYSTQVDEVDKDGESILIS